MKKIKTEDYFAEVKRIQKEDINLMRRKNHDYAPPDDPLTNFDEFGVFGIVVRLVDKFSRLKRLIKNVNQVAGETIIDTLQDIRNYCTIAQVILENKLEHGSKGNEE